MAKYVVALDQGTTSSRAIVFNKESEIIAMSQAEFPQIYPNPGWVEQNPMAIYSSQYSVLSEVLAESDISPTEIASIGITNQRETTIVWEKSTGKPVYNAIVWQCRRTSKYAEELAADEAFSAYVENATGLRIDAYFSATKIRWILDHVPGSLEKAQAGELLFGTVDTWLLWKLTDGKMHATDYTNASRTMLFNIETLKWDETILEKLGIPLAMLPEVKPSSYAFGEVNISGHLLPITGIAGDQQAALFGQACFREGQMKNTYGTGCFLLMHTGSKRYTSQHGLLTTMAASTSDVPQYAIEGSVFVGGAAIQWLRDEMRFFAETADSSYFATKVKDNGGVYFVPAFTGLAAPHWDMDARGMMIGLTRGTTRNHIIRAGLESIAYQVNDLITAIEKDTNITLTSLRVDGGASNNPFLMQFQSDISNIDIYRPEMLESTALGAAYLAGLHAKYWKDEQEILDKSKIDAVFSPKMEDDERKALVKKWDKAVGRALDWAE